MDNITLTKNLSFSQIPQVKLSSTMNAIDQEKSSSTHKYLQPDKVTISEESKDKNSAEDVDSEEPQGFVTKEERVGVGGTRSDSGKSELDETIKELSIKILEITVKIELLKAKGDDDSIKESESLEIELAILKGVLEAKMKEKLAIPPSAPQLLL